MPEVKEKKIVKADGGGGGGGGDAKGGGGGGSGGGEAEGRSPKAVNNVKYETPSPAALGVGTQKESVFIK